MSVYICMPESGTKKMVRCSCCKREWDNFDAMATSMCFECVFGNVGCQRCVETGYVFGNSFTNGLKSHIIVTIRKGNMRWLKTACGKTLDYKDLGGSTLMRPCRKCQRAWADWPRKVT